MLGMQERPQNSHPVIEQLRAQRYHLFRVRFLARVLADEGQKEKGNSTQSLFVDPPTASFELTDGSIGT